MWMNRSENTITGPVFKIASDKRELLEIKNNEIIHRKPTEITLRKETT